MATCPDNTCGIGGFGGPLPGDPDNAVTLTASAAFGGIDVRWSYPTVNPAAVAHTLLYRGIAPNFSLAMPLAVVAGNSYYDKIENDLRYYYWIQIVSVNGTVGATIGPASAVARLAIGDMIEQLTGQIDAGMLAMALRADLDQISLTNTNLLNEIAARENSEVSLAEAIASAQSGTAQALTFVNQYIGSRTSADEAIVEQLNTVAATLGSDYAAITQGMQIQINAQTGKINAMWTAQVNVNGLVGGFGINNTGQQVSAGFDVDQFWVGRTNANKRKPFIIENDVTYIDQAAIRYLMFDKLTDANGTFLVENGRIRSQFLRVIGADIDDASIGTAKIGNGQITNALIGNAAIGTANIGEAQIDTLRIAGEAVSVAYSASGSTGGAAVAFTVPAGQVWQSVNNAVWGPGALRPSQTTEQLNLSGSPTVSVPTVSVTNGGEVTTTDYFAPPVPMASKMDHGPGYHVVSCSSSGGGQCVLTSLVRKR